MPHILLYSVHSAAKKKSKASGLTKSEATVISSTIRYHEVISICTNALRHQNDSKLNMASYLAVFALAVFENNMMPMTDAADLAKSNVIEHVTIELTPAQQRGFKGGKPTSVSGISFTPQFIDFYENFFEKEIDISSSQPQMWLKQNKNRGLSEENAVLLTKLRVLLFQCTGNCKMYMWKGSHGSSHPAAAATNNRKNGITPDIMYEEFSRSMRFVLIHPFCTKADYEKLVHDEKANKEWVPKSWKKKK